MNLLEQGCTCKDCMEITKKNLEVVREKWNKGEREIIFRPYHNSCGDGCCDDYGTDVYVNGFELNWNGETPEHSKKVAKNQEIFLYATSIRGEKNHRSSISLSVVEAKCLRDTLDYMVRKLEE